MKEIHKEINARLPWLEEWKKKDSKKKWLDRLWVLILGVAIGIAVLLAKGAYERLNTTPDERSESVGQTIQMQGEQSPTGAR